MELSATVDIPMPASDVFTYIMEPANNPVWQKGMRSCAWTSEPPIGVGSQYRQEASFLGRPVVSVFEVTDYQPGRLIAFATVESTFPISVRRWVEPTGDHACTVRALIGGGPRVPSFLRGLVNRIAQRSVSRDYQNLVSILSSRAAG